VRRSSDEFKNLLYDLGVMEELPDTWTGFKDLVIGFWTEESLYTKTKFAEETWSEYCVRLKEWG